jgi:hypothetical protein
MDRLGHRAYLMSAINQIIAALGVSGGQTMGVFWSNDSFVVPAGVTSISMLAIGAGGGSASYLGQGGGGGGGGLSFSNNVSVTPGETLDIFVGSGGAAGGEFGGAGGNSRIERSGSSLVKAGGGYGADSIVGGQGGGLDGSSIGSVKHYGGDGGSGAGDGWHGGGGGQAASTAGNGTAGAQTSTLYRGGGAGGGVLIGPTSFGFTANDTTSNDINGESAPASAYYGSGAGGGVYGDSGYTLQGAGAPGNGGAVVLIWGGRTFSSGNNF